MRSRVIVAVCALMVCTISCTRSAQRGEQTAASPNQAQNPQPPSAGQPVRLSVENTDAAEPAIAAGRDGTAYVTWVEHRASGEADVWLAHLDAAGQSSSSPVRVNPDAGAATSWHGDPPTIAVAPDDTIYVGWTARAAGSAHASTIQLSASHDGGRSFAAPVKVNDDEKPAVHGLHSLAVAQDGRVYLAWLDERNVTQPTPSAQAEGHHMESNREVFVTASGDGGRTFAPNRRVAADACPCCKTALAVGRDGRLYVGWRQVLPGNFRHIAIAATTDGGQTFSPPVIVSDDRWQLAGCPVSGPALVPGADGALRVLWYSEGHAGETGLYWSESHDGGRTFAPRQLFSRGQAHGTPVLLGGGDSLAAVWGMGSGSSSHLMTAKLDEAGHVTEGMGATSSEFPAAAEVGGKLFVAYVAKSGDWRGVWLARA